MTRKHFQAIAKALRDSKPVEANLDRREFEGRLAKWMWTVQQIAGALTALHPRFDVHRFHEAAGFI